LIVGYRKEDQGREVEDGNRELPGEIVLGEVKKGEVGKAAEFTWDFPKKAIPCQGKIGKRGEVSELGRDLAGEAVDREVQDSESSETAQLRR